MEDAGHLTFELREAELAELNALAQREDRSPAEVVADAVRAKLARHREYLAAIEEGLRDIAEGRTVSHDEFIAHRAEQRRRYLADRQT